MQQQGTGLLLTQGTDAFAHVTIYPPFHSSFLVTDDRDTQCVQSLNRGQNQTASAHRRKFDVHSPTLDCGARANARSV
jgi:hypothetical protein